MQKRIVVLGGGGFIGTHLCLRLLEEGHEVFCVDIRDAVNSPLLRGVLQHPLFRYVHHNIINGFSIRCDEIYNLASPSRVRYNKALPVETLRVSVLGAINALDTARTEHARVVFASAGNIYGIGQRDPASEPGNCCSTHYILCEGKRAAEALHRAYHSEYDVATRREAAGPRPWRSSCRAKPGNAPRAPCRPKRVPPHPRGCAARGSDDGSPRHPAHRAHATDRAPEKTCAHRTSPAVRGFRSLPLCFPSKKVRDTHTGNRYGGTGKLASAKAIVKCPVKKRRSLLGSTPALRMACYPSATGFWRDLRTDSNSSLRLTSRR